MEIWKENELTKSLGITDQISLFSCVSGMRYPLPETYLQLPNPVQVFIRFLFNAIELSFIFMTVSSIIPIFETNDYLGLYESIGGFVCAAAGIIKAQYLYQNRDCMDRMLIRLHVFALRLQRCSFCSRDCLENCKREIRLLRLFCSFKFYGQNVAYFLFTVYMITHACLSPSLDNVPVLNTWFPWDFNESCLNYASTAWLQLFSYGVPLFRDVFASTFFILVAASLNHQLIILREILLLMVRSGEDTRTLLKWWWTQHVEILEIINDFTVLISSVLLVSTFSQIGVLFWAVLAVMEDDSLSLSRKCLYFTIQLSSVIFLLLLNWLGEKITENSSLLGSIMQEKIVWDLTQSDRKTLLQILVRSCRPTKITFGLNQQLCISSFSDIFKSLFGYFSTAYQIRHRQ